MEDLSSARAGNLSGLGGSSTRESIRPKCRVAEGATAPESLRPRDRVDSKETLESGTAFQVNAHRRGNPQSAVAGMWAKLSGSVTEGVR